ncbi:hypothetical protein A9D60_14515 [Leisingera sp. JC1]|nr:hypothetical protein A9D60_14515 [Leisingera sp. JC1]
MSLLRRTTKLLAVLFTCQLAQALHAEELPDVTILRSAPDSSCPKIELAVNGVFRANGLEFRNGSVSSVPNGVYKADVSEANGVLRFDITEPITRSFTLRLKPSLDEEGNAQLNSSVKDWIGSISPPQGGILAVSLHSRECELSVGWNLSKPNGIFDGIFGSGNTNHDPRQVRLTFENYEEVILRSTENEEDFFVQRRDGKWEQESNGAIVATYVETSRQLQGFQLLDDVRIVTEVLGIEVEHPRIVMVPHGFETWVPTLNKHVYQYRPDNEFIFNARRDRVAHLTDFESTLHQATFIEQILSDSTLGSLSVSIESDNRLGFVGNTNRFLLLAFAQSIDSEFSQSPDTVEAGEFMSLASFKIEGECDGDNISTVSLEDISIEFGPVIDGSEYVEFPDDLNVEDEVVEGKSRSVVKFEAWIQYQPLLPRLPALENAMPRECNSIWQKSSVTLYCDESKIRSSSTVSASNFVSGMINLGAENVSHKFNGFESLWRCSETDPSLIE